MFKRILLLTATIIMSLVLVCSWALGQSTEQGVRLNDQALELWRKARSADDYKKAIEMYQEALRIFQRFNSAKNEGTALTNLGNVYDTLGRYEEALDYHERSLEIKRKVRDAKGEAITLNNIGVVHNALGQYAKALDCHDRAVEICKRVGDAKNERINLGNMGVVYVHLGQYAKASEYFDKALAICKRTKDVQGEAVTTGYIAAVYRLSGQYPKALEYYEKSGDMFKKVGDVNNQAQQLLRVGDTRGQLGDHEKALESYKEALRLKKRLGVPIKETQKAIGVLYLEMGKIDSAETILKETGDSGGLGLLSLAKGGHIQAKQYYEKHLVSAEQSMNVTDLFSAYTGLGKACEGVEDYKAAEHCYEKGMKLTEEIRSGLMPAERKNFFEVKVGGFPRSEPAQGLTRVRMKLNKAADSIDSSEVTRARAFSDNTAQKSEGGYAGIPKEVLEKEDDLVSRVAALRKQLAKTSRDVNPDRYENINREVQKTEAELNSFVQMLWEQHKAYASVKYPRPVTLKESGLKAEECVVMFDVSYEGVGVKLIKGKEIAETYYKKWKLDDLERDIRKFRQAFEEMKLREFDAGLGESLYVNLLARVLLGVPKGTPLVIIPDGILATLPFEALVVSGKPTWKEEGDTPYPEGLTYLGDLHPISYYQSITSLTLSRTLGSKAKTGTKTMVIADPVFGPEDTRLQTASLKERQKVLAALPEKLMSIKAQTGITFPRLSQTAALGEFLKKLNPDNTDLYTGIDAKKSILFAKPLTEYGCIVFATHGYFGKDIPGIQEPVLAMTLVDQPKDQDGFLRMTEVMGMKLNANVVALTACQTGLGSSLSGEGVLSMGRAFQYAGAKSILMSLWSVSERGSVLLVEKFFEHLNAGKSKLDALKLAREEIRMAGYEHPFFWAPFVLVGEVN